MKPMPSRVATSPVCIQPPRHNSSPRSFAEIPWVSHGERNTSSPWDSPSAGRKRPCSSMIAASTSGTGTPALIR